MGRVEQTQDVRLGSNVSSSSGDVDDFVKHMRILVREKLGGQLNFG